MWTVDHPGRVARWLTKSCPAYTNPPTYAEATSTKDDPPKWGVEVQYHDRYDCYEPSWLKGALSAWRRADQTCTRRVTSVWRSMSELVKPRPTLHEKIDNMLVQHPDLLPLVLLPSPSDKPPVDAKGRRVFDTTPLFTYLRATHATPDCALHEPRDLPRRSFVSCAAKLVCAVPGRLQAVVDDIISQLTDGAPHAKASDIEYLKKQFPDIHLPVPPQGPQPCSRSHPALPVLWFAAHLASRSATASSLLLSGGVVGAIAELYWDPDLSFYDCDPLHHACYMLLRSLSVHHNLCDCVVKVLLRQEVIDTSRRQSLFLVEYDERCPIIAPIGIART